MLKLRNANSYVYSNLLNMHINKKHKQTVRRSNQGSGNGDIRNKRSYFMETKTTQFRSSRKTGNDKSVEDRNLNKIYRLVKYFDPIKRYKQLKKDLPV